MPAVEAKAKRIQSALAAARSAGVSSETIAEGEKKLENLQAKLQQEPSPAKTSSAESARLLLAKEAVPGTSGRKLSRPASASGLSSIRSSIRQKPADRGHRHVRPVSAAPPELSQETPCAGEGQKSYRVGTTERNCSFGDLLVEMKSRKVASDPAAHLKRSSLQMGVATSYMSTSKSQMIGPVAKAQDPKWSTDLKKVDAVIGLKIQYENRLSASVSGSISPELQYLPKTY